MKLKMKGFTLIELLIVVAIIAILAAIAVPNFLEARVRSQVSRVKADQRSYGTAIESYYVDWNEYPNDLIRLVDPNQATNTPYYYANGGPDGFILEELLWPLSTPVSYITDAFPREPFNARHGIVLFLGNHVLRDGAITKDKDHSLYLYIALPNDAIIAAAMPLVMGLIQTAGVNVNVDEDGGPLIRKRWFMVSPGPDTFYTFDRCMATGGTQFDCIFQEIADAAIDSRGGIYDPTNGTVSNGEVVRTAEGVSKGAAHR
ncbi:prepilin-type N-terminal cleavage/methylation domain-containing protein [Candidatus Sumerlaeota bacterium]|nr:prepilin-type N-terminal cleavage/methylation domain-containing protein [Candidatus Sumerlaeota bacterium]